MLLQKPLHGLHQDVSLSLVVRRSTGVDVVVADVWLKRRRFPFVQWIGRLHIIMPIQKDSRLSWRTQPFGVDQRIPLALDQLRLLQTSLFQLAAHELGRFLDVRLVLGKGADTRNAQEGFQALQIILMVLFVVIHPYLILNVLNTTPRALGSPGTSVVRLTSISSSISRRPTSAAGIGRSKEKPSGFRMVMTPTGMPS